jgi:hypothetical protein
MTRINGGSTPADGAGRASARLSGTLVLLSALPLFGCASLGASLPTPLPLDNSENQTARAYRFCGDLQAAAAREHETYALDADLLYIGAGVSVLGASSFMAGTLVTAFPPENTLLYQGRWLAISAGYAVGVGALVAAIVEARHARHLSALAQAAGEALGASDPKAVQGSCIKAESTYLGSP